MGLPVPCPPTPRGDCDSTSPLLHLCGPRMVPGSQWGLHNTGTSCLWPLAYLCLPLSQAAWAAQFGGPMELTLHGFRGAQAMGGLRDVAWASVACSENQLL